MTRHTLRATRLMSGAGLTAALLLSAAVPARSAPLTPVVAAADDKGQQLPRMPSALDPDDTEEACTPASAERAKQPDWSRQRLDLDRLRAHSTGAGVTVALIGTGVVPGAAGLGDRVISRGAAAEDCVGYGTFLAGLIAGTGGDHPHLAGVAPGARILALRGTGRFGEPDPALVTAAVREATDARAGVIAVAVALSDRDAELTRAVAEARRAGAVVVAAAAPDPPRGGSGESSSRTYWPAGEPGVLSVAGMFADGSRPDDAPRTDGIDLVAPAYGVVSGGPRGNGHYLGDGAPVATAYAAGAAAAVRAAHPDDSADAVVRRLTATAYPADIPQLDPYAAVTTVLGAPGAPGASADAERAADPVAVPDTSAADRTVARATLLVLLGGAGVLTVLWAAFALRTARARGWRPAGAGGSQRDEREA
ncbi:MULTISPECIES: S8 family serine peptidase [unclassified Streptomyces]|uniref:S8 family serine peptidase n=1 Tax=unclassified Streptomyces TaxID=2593676 RepID=UPI001D173D90|nr:MULTISPECIES: S8 family serine peptidase [unclassified Streptomyces]